MDVQASFSKIEFRWPLPSSWRGVCFFGGSKRHDFENRILRAPVVAIFLAFFALLWVSPGRAGLRCRLRLSAAQCLGRQPLSDWRQAHLPRPPFLCFLCACLLEGPCRLGPAAWALPSGPCFNALPPGLGPAALPRRSCRGPATLDPLSPGPCRLGPAAWPCRPGPVAWALPPGPCRLGPAAWALAAWALPPGPCRWTLAAWALPPGPCRLGPAAWAPSAAWALPPGPLPPGPCRLGPAAWALPPGPWALPPGPCRLDPCRLGPAAWALPPGPCRLGPDSVSLGFLTFCETKP